ncbi:helix-turn-helix domain-containing protein [Desulfonema magnum]|uniref:HTH domain-containing protein, Cro/C1-type n=1 Tax=Desulfonema magnum TaxID=45655 RepID=A0A975BSS8_9BACT|nr:XRE family transcriptional regulator [Desulfonema magnum]QTA90400.1 HTH domain-containing protein, Cro/C1-type [Desulfonema magnum]
MNDLERESRKVEETIAKRIRSLRLEQNWTLEKLAEVTGLSKSYLSQIENHEKIPTISTLTKIAYALGENVQSFWNTEEDGKEKSKLTIVRAGERRSILHPGAASGYSYESVTYKKPDRLMDAYIVTLDSEVSKGPLMHEGQELVFMLEGRKEFIYDGQSHIVEAGDCLYFESDRPHQGRSLDGRPARFLAVFLNPRRLDEFGG